ncbi:MAG: hypothetical protein J4G18_02950 [Anaerolineae bacterium]|nr:hypothetical protein [Anaerolineae bacterium]
MILILLIGIARLVLIIAVSALLTPPAEMPVCTLADHIRSANTNTSVGFCPAGTSHDVITIREDITLTEALPSITGAITIEGGGHTISGDNKFPIFNVQGGRLTINNLTLTKGYDEPSDANSWQTGGALRIASGGEAIVNHSLFLENINEGHGGAIGVGRSKLTVNNSSFVRNQAHGDGGAISIWESEGVIRNSSFVGNATRRVQAGGAIGIGENVTIEISNSTFHDNYAGEGGAIATRRHPLHAAVGSRTTLTHVTMVDNRAGREGYSIWVDPSDVNFKLRNSLIVDEKAAHREEGISCLGPLNENIGNLIEDGSCASMAGGDPMLAEMTGSPAHFPLLDGSPALDSADERFCLDSDQLGTPRPQGGGCDIGAFESTTALPEPPPVVPPPPCPLALQISAANTDAPAGGCPAGSGHDVIILIEDVLLDAPLPAITSEITLADNGYAIDGDNQFGIFEVDGGALTVRDATLTQGKASSGGAILLKNGGRATVEEVAFIANSAFYGGAIATESVNDRLTVSNSSFVANSAETSGGAITADGGSVDISNSAFLDNRADSRGGAIAALSGRATVTNSTLAGNAAEKGGGIYVNGGQATLNHLTVMNSEASRVIGAGIYAEAGAVTLSNSIVAGSGSGDDCSGSFARLRGNFSEDGRCAARVGGDPFLADMVAAPAHFPQQGRSPAHGVANSAFCLPTDQLGNPRTHCDVGAIESVRDPDAVTEPEAELPADCTLADQIIAANRDAPAGACPAGDGADIIRLRRNIRLSAPLPSITSDLALDGRGHTISGDSRFRIFDIEAGKVVVKHITINDGRNLGGQPEGFGGALTLRKSAKLIVVDGNFRNNKARMGGAVASIDGSHILILESSFLDNEASSKAGAVWRDGACGHIYDVTFRRNIAGELPGSIMDDYLTHMNGGANMCTDAPDVYTLSDT